MSASAGQHRHLRASRSAPCRRRATRRAPGPRRARRAGWCPPAPARTAAASASNAGSSHTRPCRVDQRVDGRGDAVVEQRRHRRVRRPGQRRACRRWTGRRRSPSTGDGSGQHEQPAQAAPVRGLLLAPRSRTPAWPDACVALVDQRREAAHLVAGTGLGERPLDRAERPRGLPGDVEPGRRRRPRPSPRRTSAAAAP